MNTTINGTIETRDVYEDNSARLQQSVMTDMAAVHYSYSRGMIAATTREAYNASSTLWQRYAMTYDEWGRRSKDLTASLSLSRRCGQRQPHQLL